MKQLTCEMCGGTDLMKQDGVFVCQSCGTKYSVEEAKKMMVEVGGTVEVKNAAQLENLLNLANSSFESKNYAQAEEFCNQVIAMDDKNYEAWKLKGEAINYQINSKNQRILEVYNCIMTSYCVLPDEEKGIKKHEIISSLKTCFEGEADFWLKQFEAGRPTNAALTRAKNAYIDAYNKMKAAFEELGLEEAKDGYLTNFDNFFVDKCNAICNDAWKSTVGYNYYRDYMGQGKDPFGRTDQRWVIANTDLYRPSKHIWDTFLEEADNLIKLLQFAEEQFNDDTNPKVMEAIYSNIAFFEECIIPSGSWKITQGYTSNWDSYKTVGWHEEYSLTDAAKNSRRTIMNKYKEKERTVPKEVEARQKAKKEKERKEKIAKYWEDHAEEKAKLDREQADLKKKMDDLNAQIAVIDKKNAAKIDELRKERDKKLPCEVEVDKQRDLIRDLETQRDKYGIFKGKEKKAIQARLDTEENPKLESLQKKATADKKAHQDKFNAEINVVKGEGKELCDEVANLKKRSDEITKELTKDR
mgnify:CR=1 FL=1